MTKLRLRGDWSDTAERERVHSVLDAVIPDDQVWTIMHAKGDEPVLTYNPSRPLEPTNGRPLRKLRADTMQNPPRYVYWNSFSPETNNAISIWSTG